MPPRPPREPEDIMAYGGRLPEVDGRGLVGMVGVPAKDMALENKLEMVEVAGLKGGFWGVDKLDPG